MDVLTRKRKHNGEIIFKNNDENCVIEQLSLIKSKIDENLLKILPAIIFVHQLYSVISNRTYVDREVEKLKNAGSIVMFKLRIDKEDISTAICLTEDIKKHFERNTSSRIIKHFIEHVLAQVKDIAIEKVKLRQVFKLSENQIKELVHENALVIKSVGTFWLSFPKAGEFVKAYNAGRRYLVRALKIAKFNEILENELLKRKFPKRATLGVEYYISDLVGSQDALRKE